MDVVAAFVADAEAAVLVQPGDCALDDPALFAEPGAVRLSSGLRSSLGCGGGGSSRRPSREW